ncbi:hypothetical protein BH23GEM9_BH23GEM9_31700 [soil metagenome]
MGALAYQIEWLGFAGEITRDARASRGRPGRYAILADAAVWRRYSTPHARPTARSARGVVNRGGTELRTWRVRDAVMCGIVNRGGTELRT